MKQEIVKIEYDQTLSGFVELLELARRTAARSVNALMTATYWEISKWTQLNDSALEVQRFGKGLKVPCQFNLQG
jgi:hypothetical protein